MSDLRSIIDEILARQKATKRKRITKKIVGTEREQRMRRVLDSRWADESLILIVNRIHCATCGRDYEAPVPRLFLRRYHPKWGVHEMALNVSPAAPILSSHPRVEYFDDDTPICQACINPDVNGAADQLCFDFTDIALFNTANAKEVHLRKLNFKEPAQ